MIKNNDDIKLLADFIIKAANNINFNRRIDRILGESGVIEEASLGPALRQVFNYVIKLAGQEKGNTSESFVYEMLDSIAREIGYDNPRSFRLLIEASNNNSIDYFFYMSELIRVLDNKHGKVK